MARTPDRRPGESDEEGIVLENRSPGDNPSLAGGIRYVDGSFSFKDSLGLFNPRSGLAAAGSDTELQYNYLGFLSASSDLKFARDRKSLIATNISGSHTSLSDGSSFIIAGGNMSVVTGSNGSILLSTVNSGTISGISAGTGLLGGGTSGSVSLRINDSVVATVSGTTFTGFVKFSSGLSGSLTRLVDGTSYIASGTGINVSSGSTGRITLTLSNTGSAGSYGSASQVPVFSTDAQGRVSSATNTSIQISESQVTNLSSSLSDRALKSTSIIAGNGLLGGGDLSTNRTFRIDNAVVATVSGTVFTGVVKFDSGLSGSLTRLVSGDPYIVGGSNIVVTTGSNGTITIDAVGGANGGGLVDGFGSPNYVSKWQDTNTLTNSIIYDDGVSVGIGTVAGGDRLTVMGNSSLTGSLLPGSDATYNLGSSSKRWKIFSSNLQAYGITNFYGSIVPSNNSNYDIGTTANNWRNIFATNISGSLIGSGLTLGSVVFSGPDGLLTGSNSNFFWDNENNRLGIGTNSPLMPLEVFGTSGSLFSVTDNLSGSLFSICGVSGVPIFEVFSDFRVKLGGGYNLSALTVTGSLVGVGTSSPASRLHVLGTSSPSTPALVVQAGSSSPTANLLDIRNSSGNTVASLDHTGAFTASFGSFTTSITTPTLTATSGLSGSLTKLSNGNSYLVAGPGISIITGSNGSVVITNDGTVGDITAVTAGRGLSGGGTSGQVSLSINDSIVATVSGTRFTGVTNHTAGLSGSLTRLSDGSSYIKAGDGITVVTGSNGSVTISLGAISYATASFTDATSVTVNHDIGMSLYDIEVFDASYDKMIPKSATATSPTQSNIAFSIPTSGYIVVGAPVAGGSGTSTLGSLTTTVGSAPYFGSRAWVNFNGMGTVSIRTSQNVSSITDYGTGHYSVNFTTPMADDSYNTVLSAEGSSGSGPLICGPQQSGTYSASSVSIHVITYSGSDSDSEKISVTVIR